MTKLSTKATYILIATLFVFGILIGGIVSYLAFTPRQKQAYVQLSELYGEFQYKLELEKELTQLQTVRKKTLDSLQQRLGELAAQPTQTQAFIQQRDAFYQIQTNYEEERRQVVQAMDQKIWKQLNQYVSDYGRIHGYHLILGADGTGTVMYVDPSTNITSELKDYVNQRYKGKPKV
jgi:outer membrane protein